VRGAREKARPVRWAEAGSPANSSWTPPRRRTWKAHGANRGLPFWCRCTAGPRNPGLVFTERRSDLRAPTPARSRSREARRDPGEEPARPPPFARPRRRSGLFARTTSRSSGAYRRIGDLRHPNYKVPSLCRPESRRDFGSSPTRSEVESVLIASLDDLRARIRPNGAWSAAASPIKDRHLRPSVDALIWGATARNPGAAVRAPCSSWLAGVPSRIGDRRPGSPTRSTTRRSFLTFVLSEQLVEGRNQVVGRALNRSGSKAMIGLLFSITPLGPS